MSIAIAEARYSFPNGEPESPALIAVPVSILDQILSEVQALRDEVQDLKATVTRQDGELATLRQQITALEATQETQAENQLIQLRLIKDLRETVQREPEPTATERDRIERIEHLCTNAPGHTISLSELRGRLGIDKSVLSRLLKKIDKERFYLKRSTTDKRIRYLCLRPEVR